VLVYVCSVHKMNAFKIDRVHGRAYSVTRIAGRVLMIFGRSVITLNAMLSSSCSLRHEGVCGSAVGIATGYGLDDRGVGVLVPIFSSPRLPCRFWGPPSLLSKGHQELLPWV
jgi:hypothetical protein